jgi:hypothetical protein
VARVLAGDPEAVLARLAELHEAGATWCVLAPVAAPRDPSLASLSNAAGMLPRQSPEGIRTAPRNQHDLRVRGIPDDQN